MSECLAVVHGEWVSFLRDWKEYWAKALNHHTGSIHRLPSSSIRLSWYKNEEVLPEVSNVSREELLEIYEASKELFPKTKNKIQAYLLGSKNVE